VKTGWSERQAWQNFVRKAVAQKAVLPVVMMMMMNKNLSKLLGASEAHIHLYILTYRYVSGVS
jgi:hypothetical protein